MSENVELVLRCIEAWNHQETVVLDGLLDPDVQIDAFPSHLAPHPQPTRLQQSYAT